MEEKFVKMFWKSINNISFCILVVGFVFIAYLHYRVPIFPILFLFDLSVCIGHPLFIKYVLKKKWFECTKDNYLSLKYILLPVLVMELLVSLYYWQETLFVFDVFREVNGWK